MGDIMTKLLATDLILASRDGDPTTIIGKLNGPDAKDRAYIQAMVHYCAVAGIDPFIALTQWLVETANGESVRWNQDYNAAGIGIPADSTVQPFTIKDGDEAARIHAQALYSAVTGKLHDRIPLPEASVEWFTEIWLPKVNNRNYPGVTTVDDLNTRYTANGDSHATWAFDANYVTTLISRCATFYPDLKEQSSFRPPVEPPIGGSMSVRAIPNPNNWPLYDVAGLSVKVPSPVPIRQRIIPANQTLQRPGYTLHTPYRWIQHENANYTSTAADEAQYLINGAEGRQASWHFTTDDDVIYQSVPIDEVTWQSADGAGEGNMNGISNELCVRRGINTAQARFNAESLCAGITYALSVPMNRINSHWDMNANNAPSERHHCPDEMLNDGTWPTVFKGEVQTQWDEMDAFIATPAEPVWTPATTWPWMIEGNPGYGEDHYVGKTEIIFAPANFKNHRKTARLTTANRKGKQSGKPIEKNTPFFSAWICRSEIDPATFRFTRVNADGSGGNRIAAADLWPKDQVTANGTVSRRASKDAPVEIVRKRPKPVKKAVAA